MAQKEHIVIIGGGFAGINLAKQLDKSRFDITIVDKNNYHSFPPLFYQVASGGLDPASISFPFRREMRKSSIRGARYHMGEVTEIDTERHEVKTKLETIHYDKLVIAAGTTNNFFGNPDLIKHVYTLKSTVEAVRCRNEILDRMERASISKDPEKRKRLLSFVVIGGGPTGVEIAGAIGEMKRYILPREYPDIQPDEMTITLIEGTDRLLRTMSEEASAKAMEYLNKLMVDVQLNKLLKSYDDNIVTLADGTQLYSEMVIWTAGVTSISFDFKGVEVPTGPGKRFMVDEYNRVTDVENLFAIGDIAYHADEEYPHGCPQLAQGAIQQARTLAKNLNKGTFYKPFRYKDKGSMATVGRNLAVADLKHVHLSGWFAWLTWMFVHLITLMGMRNKVTVLVNWTWAYWTYSTSLRLLFRPLKYPLRSHWGEK